MLTSQIHNGVRFLQLTDHNDAHFTVAHKSVSTCVPKVTSGFSGVCAKSMVAHKSAVRMRVSRQLRMRIFLANGYLISYRLQSYQLRSNWGDFRD